MARIPMAAATALLAVSVSAFAATPPSSPSAPPEVIAAAPAGTTIVAFATSGGQPNADAAAVFESTPDKDDVRHRTLVVFGKSDGKFISQFSNDKVIGCSKCTQFHDDPFWPDNVKVAPTHITIDQGDGGETPSTTSISLVRSGGIWKVERATRQVVNGGRGDSRAEAISLPSSGLAKDLDAKWAVPVFYNTIIVNKTTGRFIFRHATPTPGGVWEEVKGRCNKQECSIVVQQQDGCISLVQDASARSFGAGTPDDRNENAASAKAMAACEAAGGQQCRVVRTDCTNGI